MTASMWSAIPPPRSPVTRSSRSCRSPNGKPNLRFNTGTVVVASDGFDFGFGAEAGPAGGIVTSA
jgi:hypothetical protein